LQLTAIGNSFILKPSLNRKRETNSMEKQEVRYRVTLSAYHQAAIYGLVMRNAKVFRLALLLLGGVVMYSVWTFYSGYELSFLPIYMVTGYMIYIFILLGREEHKILRYSKSKESMIGMEYVLRFDSHTLGVEVVKTKERVQAAIKKFPAAVETGAFFLLYLDQVTCFIVPTPQLSDEQRALLRTALAENLGERFISRYVK